MEASSLAIVGLGMVTSVGFSAKETAANIRASMARSSLQPLIDQHHDAFTVATVVDRGLPPLPATFAHRKFRTRREERMLRLATLALNDVLKTVALAKPCPLLLALPEHETTNPISAEGFLDDFHSLNPGVFHRASSKAIWRGRSGGLAAMACAAEMLRTKQAERVFVGGVDSFLSPWVLGSLDRAERAKSEDHPDSFVPGEGAGVILVTQDESARRGGLEALARVSIPGEGVEPGHWASKEIYHGEGLCDAVQSLLDDAAPAQPFAEVYSTMNGESYWTKEWGMVRVRHGHAFAERARLHHPFEFTGDLGAAAGPVLTGLAVVGLNAKYRQSPIMIYASNDFGPRAAIAISSQS